MTVGGAERAARKRRQQEALTTANAAPEQSGSSSRIGRTAVAGLAVVALLGLVVGGGIWLQNRADPGDLPVAVPLSAAGPEYDVRFDGDAIVAGSDDAPVTVDVYEDYFCPGCGQFEVQYGGRLADAVAAGDLRVVYHQVAILDRFSEPEGYSTMAAGAAFCAVDAGIFPRYHASLFATQPVEGGEAPWTRPQLQQLGRDLGAGEGFVTCIRRADEARVERATQAARLRMERVRSDGQLGTPSVLVDGRLADLGDTSWLDDALGAAQR